MTSAVISARFALKSISEKLSSVTDRPDVESEILVSYVLSCRRIDLYVDDPPLSSEESASLDRLVERRLRREPLQYVTGVAGFYGIDLMVGPGCLIPRPESEILVEASLGRISGSERVVDIGTGSGAIACAVARQRPDAEVLATEVSLEASRYARANFAANGLPSENLLVGDLYAPLHDGWRSRVDMIISNPPYLSDAEIAVTQPEVGEFEPRLATTAGPRGSEVTERIIEGASDWLKPRGWLLLETQPAQAPELVEMMGRFSEIRVIQDLTGRDRVVEAQFQG